MAFSPDQSLTARLLSLYPAELESATKHDFLTQAGKRTLSQQRLSRWLVQDKHYQVAYVKFVSRLIAKLDLDHVITVHDQVGEEDLAWKTFESLFAALQAIKIEIEFYDQTVKKYGLALDKEDANDTTREYEKLFERANSPDASILNGMVVLWGTEYVYLQAWTWAKEQSDKSEQSSDKGGAVAALHNAFIPNWTSKEFKEAVLTLEEIVNSWAQSSNGKDIEICANLWKTVLELETNFWPS